MLIVGVKINIMAILAIGRAVLRNALCLLVQSQMAGKNLKLKIPPKLNAGFVVENWSEL